MKRNKLFFNYFVLVWVIFGLLIYVWELSSLIYNKQYDEFFTYQRLKTTFLPLSIIVLYIVTFFKKNKNEESN
ncbi:hypothetical protein SAMN05444344_1459 [Tenacibaculum mesophilum]|uniref:Uncharacterized protein n=1 Tax=Tenacibaculum mesophilum TaxID=104268 RepID=A0ABM7CG85_9FLAO|nr:hypothetical protein D6200_09605 [Tenacibaculum mesophilum]BFF36349.1 hypothetical protein BACT7_12110 [Tenacibaculum mesophilum]GFD78388.1 hypothetical protein KUL118_12500 [Tenacibaculum sp. KUL118]GFE01149.1 hypothetical protein KUL156_37410 [Alteromonas sp. KUL156]SHF74004.1 hypothetical protein SAMN05444344_1459 [Tenacibaculum mesophilum]